MSGREGIAQSLVWGYVLLEELLHKQMLLCAVGHPQRKGGIKETQGKKVSPSLLFIFFFFFFCFPGALYVHSAALRVWVDVSLILLLVQLNLS